uniref:Reverse transcriptase domain-containing protein n=1 Tax=Tanacetum cinerariifolium TaxID=118510 RepID=A0A6L2NJX7_TANCI|nr:reverse transcriptase domain-containing protein [Tanacetum cinerariifolium]
MDFVTKLPKTSTGQDTIWVIVDQLTKSAYFLPMMETNSMKKLTRQYLKEVVSRYGVPVSIISNQESKFTSHFLKSLNKALGTQLDMSTAYHPQTDGQSERTIQTLENMLHACVIDLGKGCDRHLPLVEFSYTTVITLVSRLHCLKLSTAKNVDCLFGRMRLENAQLTGPEIVHEATEKIIQIKKHIQAARDRQKSYADRRRNHWNLSDLLSALALMIALAEAKASMDALEKKIDGDIKKFDVSIKAMKEESDAKLDAKIKELKQLILGTAPSQSTHVDPVPQITKVAAKTPRSNKLDPGTTNDMNGEKLKLHTDSLFVEGIPTGFGHEFGVDPQAAINRGMQHLMGTNQTGERVHPGARINQAGNIFAYHGFEHQMRKLKMLVFEEKFLAITQEESARAYVALFEKLACQLVGIQESVMEATFIKGIKPALRAAIRVMNPAGLNNAMELAVSIEDNQLYEGVTQSKGVAVVVEQTTSKGDNF